MTDGRRAQVLERMLARLLGEPIEESRQAPAAPGLPASEPLASAAVETIAAPVPRPEEPAQRKLKLLRAMLERVKRQGS